MATVRHCAATLYWIAETHVDKADYLIATERWPCADGTTAVLVDEVKRFGRSFAQIYANRRGLDK